MNSANRPSKHHYIPECYLKAWTGKRGELCEFKRGYQGRVRPRWTAPGGTGYAIDLYAIPELGDAATDIESLFLKMVDTRASVVLTNLRGEDQADFSEADRSVWATFLLSLLLRSPESINALKDAIVTRWHAPRPELQALYEEKYRGPDDPELVDDYLASTDSGGAYRLIYQMIPEVMTHANVGKFIVNMKWGVLSIPPELPEFLTSDRPVIMSNGLANADGHLAVPISPRKLFFAARDHDVAQQILGQTPKSLLRRTNQLIVERARRFVYSTDKLQLRFVQNRMSTELIPTMGETIAEKADW